MNKMLLSRARLLFCGLTYLLLGASCTPNAYVVEGNIIGTVAEGKTVYLYNGVTFYKTLVDSTVIVNGHFNFSSDTLPEPGVYTLVFFPDSTRGMVGERGYVFRPAIPIFLHEGKMAIEADWEKIPTEDFYGCYDYSPWKITAPETMKWYMEYVGKIREFKAQSGKAWDAYTAYLMDSGEKHVSTGIRVVEDIDRVTAETKEYLKSLIALHRNDVFGLFVFQVNLSLFTVQEIEEMAEAFSAEMLGSEYGKNVLAKAEKIKQTAIGSKFVDYAFQTSQGEAFSLSDVAGKGKYILFECWASWCGPCKADIPHLKEVYELYHPYGFEIVSISMDNDKEKWQKEMENQQMPWLQVSDLKGFTGEFSKIYNFNSIPTCIFVNPEGVIIDRNMRGSWLDKKLIELYGNKFGDKY